jgi:serine phosphatase RsbU (regulator of sigma subunit)
MLRFLRPLIPRNSAARAAWRWLRGTFAGRAILFGVVVKLAALLLRLVLSASRTVEAIDTAGDISLLTGAVFLGYRLFADLKGVLLWRVRRKLTLSYIFIGFVPVLLVIVLFLAAGLILFYNVSQYMVSGGMRTLVDQAAFLAESGAVGLQGSDRDELRERLDRRFAGAAKAFPFVSYAVVPARRTCDAAASSAAPVAVDGVMTAGPWRHLNPPREIPSWVPCAGSAALIAYRETPEAGQAGTPHTRIVARAVAWPDERNPAFAVVVDLPFSATLAERLRDDTGIHVGNVSLVMPTPEKLKEGKGECAVRPMQGRMLEPAVAPRTLTRKSSGIRNPLERPLDWVAFFEAIDWETGHTCDASMGVVITVADLYERLSATPGSASGATDTFDLGTLLLGMVALLGILFLVIQLAAFMMGLSLARSITGSVHELFGGTERVRQGDFTHKIPIHSRDLLGELAESFNSMTSSIEDLLQQKAEKERLEQELRIARSIQMSLLPQGRIAVPGLSLSAHCEPAREVGGDYYDYLPIDDHRVGLLIADVAGKGTSAALYMAELKGLMLSLSQLHTSPRRLLIDANRIISRHLDSRSFITITYAVVDMAARTLTYARAGHCPLIYVPGPQAASRAPQILAPDGLVLGLQIDDGRRFNGLLQESTIALTPGDLFLFYTDGLTEAMDPDGNIYGDARLGALMYEHADLPFEELRERILREIAAFAGSADQQDDMTMLLLKVEDTGESAGRRDRTEIAAVGR